MDANREWDLLAALREFRLLEERRSGGSLQAGEWPRWEELRQVLGKHAPLLAPLPAGGDRVEPGPPAPLPLSVAPLAARPGEEAEPLVLVPVPEPVLRLDSPVDSLPARPILRLEDPASPPQPILLLGQPAPPVQSVLQLDRPAPQPAMEQPVPLPLVRAAPAGGSPGAAPAIEQPVPLAPPPSPTGESPSPVLARNTMPFFVPGGPLAPPVPGEPLFLPLPGEPLVPEPGAAPPGEPGLAPFLAPAPPDLGSPPPEEGDAIPLTELADQTRPPGWAPAPPTPLPFGVESVAQPLLPVADARAALFGGALRSPTVVDGRHEVALQLQDGALKHGLLHDPDLEDAHLDLFPLAGGAPERIRADEVRAIFFLLAAGQLPPPPEGRRVAVTFEDGRQLWGYRPEGEPMESGFFLVPGDRQTNTARIYVFRSAVKTLTEG